MPDETVLLDSVARTTANRTAWDTTAWCHRRRPRIIDRMLALGLVTHDELDRTASRHRGERGSRRAAETFTLADAGAQSPPEVHVRVRLSWPARPARSRNTPSRRRW